MRRRGRDAKPTATFRATDDDGRRVDDPTFDQVVAMVGRCAGDDGAFLIVEALAPPSSFVQALWQPTGWRVERQHGSIEEHFVASAAGPEQVLEAITSWMAGDPLGADGLAWGPLER